MKTKMTGKQVTDVLLALGDGDSIVIEGRQFTSFEEHGFDVEDLREGGVEHLDREEVARLFVAAQHYEVLR